MSDETITLEHLQRLHDRLKEAYKARMLHILETDLKGTMKYKQALDLSVKLDLELEKGIVTYLTLNPGIDLDEAFANKDQV